MDSSPLEHTNGQIKEAVRRLCLGRHGNSFLTEMLGSSSACVSDMIVPAPGGTGIESIHIIRTVHRGFEEAWLAGGGVRMHPFSDSESIEAQKAKLFQESDSLSKQMTVKFAVQGIPERGAKGVICIDPRKYTRSQLHPMIDKFVETLFERNAIGPFIDRMAPDMYTDSEMMDWITERYGYLRRISKNPDPFYKGVATGKPTAKGGIAFRTVSTSIGMLYAFNIMRKHLHVDLPAPTVVVNGLGKVGLPFIQYAAEISNMKIVAVRDRYERDEQGKDIFAGIYQPKGISADELARFLDANSGRYLKGFEDVCHGMVVKNKLDFCALPVDVYVPAAMENEITGAEAEVMRCKVVNEGSNSPTTRDADSILGAKGILDNPDIFSNSGGGLVSYFEHGHCTGRINTHSEAPIPDSRDDEPVHAALVHYFNRNGKELFDIVRGANVSPRLAAYMLAMQRLYPYFLSKRRLVG